MIGIVAKATMMRLRMDLWRTRIRNTEVALTTHLRATTGSLDGELALIHRGPRTPGM